MASTLRRLVPAALPCRRSRKPSPTVNASVFMLSNMHAPSATSITGPPSPGTLAPNCQVERMNRTIKDATVKRFYYETHDQLRGHLANSVAAYNFAKRLKTLQGLTLYEFICKCWTKEPQRFTSNPHHQIPG